MATTTNNILLKGLRGAIGKEIVIKQYGKKTVVTKYPDMSKVKPSGLQKERRSIFKEAVNYAKAIIYTPELKEQYQQKVKRGQTVYHYALREYLATV